MRAPASSSSTSRPQSRRYRATRSATTRSSPDGLGSAASSQKRSTTSGGTGRRLLRDFDVAARPCAVERSRDELAEERSRPRGPRLELGMELRCDEPWMVGQLDDLDEAALLERAADDETGVDNLLAVRVVDLVAMPMPLGDHRLVPVHVARPGTLRELDRLRAETHRATEVLDVLLLGEQVDDRERGLGIHLGRVRAVHPDDVARELRDGDVHAEADAEVRDRILTSDATGQDLPLPPA